MRTNKKFAIALAIICTASCVTNYFNVLVTPMIIINFVFSAFVGFIAMMQVYLNEEWHDNPGRFWFIYSTISGAILISTFYVAGFHVIGNHLATAIMIGLSPTLVPVLGVFLGDCGRVLIKAQPSVI